MRLAKQIMTLVLLGGSALSFVLDWSSNHLLNPLWHPHARFHAAILLFLLGGISVMGTWLLWRRSSEPRLGIKVAMLISVSYWTPFFYVPYLLPSTTWWAGKTGAAPRVVGVTVYPNLIVAALFLAFTLVAYLLSRERHPERYGEDGARPLDLTAKSQPNHPTDRHPYATHRTF